MITVLAATGRTMMMTDARICRHLGAALFRHLPAAARSEPGLLAALRQGAEAPGKLVRGRLAYAGARRHGFSPARATELACALEYYHTASLLLDDLPCMDDAMIRRGQPCVHRRHGEATAILAALALINRAYALVHSAFAARPRGERARAAALLDRRLGLPGLVGGQAWDLAFGHTERSAALVSRIAAGKTGALLSLAVQLPALAAKPSAAERRALDSLCLYWGQAYQVADDLADLLAGTAADKSPGRDRVLARPNLALALGLPRAAARLQRLHAQSTRALATLRRSGGARWDYLNAAQAALACRLAPEAERQHHAA